MDFLDKAQDLLDRAQEKMADATTLAAWKANQAVRVKTLDNQRKELERQIEAATLQLGNGVYQMWKNRGGRDDQKMEELCRALDQALGRYREVTAELAQLNQAVYDGAAVTPRSPGIAGTATILPPAQSIPAAQILPPASPPREQPRPAAPPAAFPPPVISPVSGPPPTSWPPRERPPAPPPVTVTPAPARAAKAKSCPSCGSTVPADETYCPHCGYMAR